MDEAKKVAMDLLEAVRKLQQKEAPNPGRHTQALHTLAKIFRGETEYLPDAAPHSPQTSTNPTEQDELGFTPVFTKESLGIKLLASYLHHWPL